MAEVWVAGEALIDLVPRGDARLPIVGGGPANTAKALAKLGIKTSFIGGISSDAYGELIRKELSLIDLSKTLRSDLPTAFSRVTIDKSGSASYEFKLDNTATFDFRRDWLPSGTPEVLHIGSLAALVHPGSTELFEWAKGIDSSIIYDPNVRPSVESDRELYRSVIERWFGISTVIKMSDEDLKWLGYSGAHQLFEFGAKLLVITRGSDGIDAYSSSSRIFVNGVDITVVDTVGAGDTVGAIIVEGVIKYGIEDLVDHKLFEVLNRAAKAAAITCSRAGANPPNHFDLD